MNESLRKTYENKIAQCEKNLLLHQFKVDVIENKDELLELLNDLLGNNESVSVGGSMTLFESGVIDFLQNHKGINYLDRYNSDTPVEVYKQALTCDTYITSTNALTLDGQLYNVDGTGNRVAALTYGPGRVLVIAGFNKLVKDIDAAIKRVEEIAAPANCVRLNRETPCARIGSCVNCNSSQRICSTKVITSRSHIKERIHVIIVKEDFGY